MSALSVVLRLHLTVYIRNSNYTNPSNTAGYTHKMSIYSIQSWFYKCSQFKIMVKTNASYSRVSVNLQMSQFWICSFSECLFNGDNRL